MSVANVDALYGKLFFGWPKGQCCVGHVLFTLKYGELQAVVAELVVDFVSQVDNTLNVRIQLHSGVDSSAHSCSVCHHYTSHR
jgi:hypothetical protein